MKLRLKMEGGAYGSLELEEIDTESPEIDIPEEALSALEPESEAPGDDEEATVALIAPRTEGQLYELEVTDDDGNAQIFRYPESDVDENPRLKQLIGAVWKQAKPVVRE